MPSIHSLAVGSHEVIDIDEVPNDKATKILSTYAWTVTTNPPFLEGEPSRLRFFTHDRYVLRLESKLGSYDAGYYLLEEKLDPQGLDAILKK